VLVDINGELPPDQVAEQINRAVEAVL